MIPIVLNTMSNTGNSVSPGSPTVDPNPNLYELHGQSNANGFAAANLISSDLVDPLTNCYIYNNDVEPNEWQVLHAGVNNGGGLGVSEPFQGYFGVEMRLMKLLRDAAGGVRQNIIKFANGGANIYYDPAITNSWSPTWTNQLFYKSNQLHDKALIDLGDLRPPIAYIWIQGENDAYGNPALTYKDNLINLFAFIRAYYRYPTMRIIVVRLGNDPQLAIDSSQVAIIRAAQEFVGALPYNTLVSADGLFVNSTDHIHYTADSLNTLAYRIFDALST